MSNIVTTMVARRMNFAGRGGKVVIQKMKLLQVVIGMQFLIILHITHHYGCIINWYSRCRAL
jgi:hypothetical protein